MNDSNLLQTLGQVTSESASEVFRDHLRGLVRQMISDVMSEEVTHLCGAKHRPGGEDVYRHGSSPGRVIYEGQREEIVRPRVRQRNGDGSTSEVPLTSYKAASCPQQLRASIVAALVRPINAEAVGDALVADCTSTTQPASPVAGEGNADCLYGGTGTDVLFGEGGHDPVDLVLHRDRPGRVQHPVRAVEGRW